MTTEQLLNLNRNLILNLSGVRKGIKNRMHCQYGLPRTKKPTGSRQWALVKNSSIELFVDYFFTGTKPTCVAIFWPSSLTAKSTKALVSPVGAPFV